MSYEFQLSFWHPFGPHAGESTAEIIDRKRREIESKGWTLWSFTYRPMLKDWHQQLRFVNGDVFVFCSEGRGAVDPVREGSLTKTIECRSYRFVTDTAWQPMPTGVRVPHPFQPSQKQQTGIGICGTANSLADPAISAARSGLVIAAGRMLPEQSSSTWRVPHYAQRERTYETCKRRIGVATALSCCVFCRGKNQNSPCQIPALR